LAENPRNDRICRIGVLQRPQRITRHDFKSSNCVRPQPEELRLLPGGRPDFKSSNCARQQPEKLTLLTSVIIAN
jgi:hypothetical protein